MSRALVLAALTPLPAGLVVASCRAKTTEIVVVVDGDLAIPGEMDDVVVEVRGRGGFTRTFDASGAALPATVEIEASDPAEPVTVVVTARAGGRVVLERRVDTGFVSEESRALEVMLCRDCIGVTCAADETCTEHGCARIAVSASDLPAWSGAAPPRPSCGPPSAPPEGGVVDARADADAGDADAADAAPDTGACIPQAQVGGVGDAGPVVTLTLDTCKGPMLFVSCKDAGLVHGALVSTPQLAGSYKVDVASGETLVMGVNDRCIPAGSGGAGCGSPASGFVNAGRNIFVAYVDGTCGDITFTATPP